MGRGGDVAGGLAGRGFARGFQKSSSVSKALSGVQREVRTSAAAVAKARLQESDAAGRVRVAETQLAEARSRYAAGSSQVVRAEEALASAQRRQAVTSASLKGATDRLTQAQKVLQSAQAGVGRSGGVWSQLSRDLAPARAQMNGLTASMGAFYRTSAGLAPVRSMVSGLSMAWTRASGVMSGLGPVVLRPLAKQFTEVARNSATWARDAVAKIPGVGRAVATVGQVAGRAGIVFGSLGRAGATMARSIISTVGPVGAQIAASLGRGFQSAVTAAGRAAASIGRAFQGVLGGAVTAAVVGVTASLKGGFDRLVSVENATAKMKGFGLAAETVEKVMGDVKSAVTDTMYTTGDMANIAAQALVAGVKPGEQLNKLMSAVKNTAAGTGSQLSEIGDIMGKVAASGRARTLELNQLQMRGIPIWNLLAESMGKTVDEVRDLATEGIDLDTVVGTLNSSMGKMASEMGGTTTAALANMRSSFSRFGEALMKESFPGVKALADAVKAVMNAAIELLGPIKAAFGLDEVGPGIQKITDFTARVTEFTESLKSGSAEGTNAVGQIVAKIRELAPVLGLAAAAAIPMMGAFLSSLPVIGGLFAGLGPGLLAGLAPIIAW